MISFQLWMVNTPNGVNGQIVNVIQEHKASSHKPRNAIIQHLSMVVNTAREQRWRQPVAKLRTVNNNLDIRTVYQKCLRAKSLLLNKLVYLITFSFQSRISSIRASTWETLSLTFVNNKGTDEPAHPCSLISAFAIHVLKSMIFKLASSEISIF